MMLATLPNDARDGKSHSRSASMSRATGRNQTSERKAMSEKRAPERRAWNKGLEVGKRDGFTRDQVKRIRGLLADRGVPGLRDLALFSVAIDTMLHGQDLLLSLLGRAASRWFNPARIEVARARGMPPVRCALSKVSTKALEKWITASGKKRTDYLFHGRGVEGRHPMGQRQLNQLLKLWGAVEKRDPSDYSVELFTPDEGSPHFERYRQLQTVGGIREWRAQRDISVSQPRLTQSRSVGPSISDAISEGRHVAPRRIAMRMAGMVCRPGALSKQKSLRTAHALSTLLIERLS